jgi:GNAT superfamily N-acetyltransferase
MSAMDFTVRPATSAQWPALEDLFGRSGASNGCWCMYWRIGPRYRDRPRADNKEDLRQLAASGRPPGLLAFHGDQAVGWCELAPRAELAWLARARYLGPVDDLPVWSVPCFYVRSSHRGRGVMDALIEGALPTAATAGAPALEAYPVDTTVPSHTGNLFPGIAAAFARHGFEVVARRKPDRPVMRKLLEAPGTSPPDLHSGCTPSALHQVGVSRTLGGGGHAAADLHAGVRPRSAPGCAAP